MAWWLLLPYFKLQNITPFMKQFEDNDEHERR